jgi:hypothetical protein
MKNSPLGKRDSKYMLLLFFNTDPVQIQVTLKQYLTSNGNLI